MQLCAAAVFGLCLNTWSAGRQAQQTLSAVELAERPIAVGGGEVGDLLRKWYSEGTAAGNVGDYYDNRDGRHSRLNLAPYPQLQAIEYSEEQVKARQNWGMQEKILPHVVFGNSSTSAPPSRGGSNLRGYYTQPRGLEFLFGQYARNNLYIYPEHRDHDPGHNGVGGYGDLFPTNTPYLIASQGSSGSDQAFMRVLPFVLAAFRPEVKRKLIQSGLLMPTIQMILRITNSHLRSSAEYLTGKAHPSVFLGRDVNAKKMVEMAHGISLSTIPPIALITVLKEDTPVNGIDYFDPERTEKLADTPAVIARIFRGSDYLRKMTVSAEGSGDLNNRPLKFHWVVLRGDPDRIKIEYLNDSRSVAEIEVPYHARFPVSEDSTLESNRVDIGVFVHNGTYYSPPAFITFYALDSEARTYGADGRPIEIAYGVGTSATSISDWQRFFNTLGSNVDSWPARFLRKQFTPGEITALIKVADEYRKKHATLLDAQEKQETAGAARNKAVGDVKTLTTKQAAAEKALKNHQSEEARTILTGVTGELEAALKRRDETAAGVRAASRAVSEAEKSEKQVLEKRMPQLNLGAAELVQQMLDSLRQDPSLWTVHAEPLKALYESTDKEAREEFDDVRKLLILFGVAESSDDSSFRLSPIIRGEGPLIKRLTRYEKGMIERVNAVVLSRIIFPGIVRAEWRENYVDHRIASYKQWRDVYRYAPDGTSGGWRRYQPDMIWEFNAEGLLVLDEDSQGRCTRARVVRYELDPQRRNPEGRISEPFLRKVTLVPVDTFREYEYDGEDDWKGRVQLR